MGGFLRFRNFGRKTIEEDLMTALFKSNLITQEAFDQPQTMQFQRAARTDKGVSAVRQIVSLKMRKCHIIPFAIFDSILFQLKHSR